jgi:hypothetical protein
VRACTDSDILFPNSPYQYHSQIYRSWLFSPALRTFTIKRFKIQCMNVMFITKIQVRTNKMKNYHQLNVHGKWCKYRLLGGPHTWSGSCGAEKNLLPLAQIEPGHPAHSHTDWAIPAPDVSYLHTYFRFTRREHLKADTGWVGRRVGLGQNTSDLVCNFQTSCLCRPLLRMVCWRSIDF